MRGRVPVLELSDFERMKIVARSLRVELRKQSDVQTIFHLADTFRAILRESATRTIIRRGLEVAENRQSKKGPAVKRGHP